MIETTFTTERDGTEIEVAIYASYYPGADANPSSSFSYVTSGDPGDPSEPEEIDILGASVELTQGDIELANNAIRAQHKKEMEE